MLAILQVVVSIILIALILIQERSSGLSTVFGGAGNTPYQTRRGVEKMIFVGTIVCAALFLTLAVGNLIL